MSIEQAGKAAARRMSQVEQVGKAATRRMSQVTGLDQMMRDMRFGDPEPDRPSLFATDEIELSDLDIYTGADENEDDERMSAAAEPVTFQNPVFADRRVSTASSAGLQYQPRQRVVGAGAGARAEADEI